MGDRVLQIGRDGRAPVLLDIAKLIVTKLLVQANSGGGKSYAMRVIAEQSMDQIQTIVLDPDGEFGSLRELHDILLVGPDGDLDADVRAAGLLAQRLVEKRCSSVIDLSELEIPERQAFVRDFCLALMQIPKAQIHPMLVLIDEAQEFAPDPHANRSESTKAVLSLMTRGRKRGIGVCLGTQRVSELHKTAASMANNRLFGRTAQDTDRKRAAADLGLESADQRGLRELEPGVFWAFGTAFSHTDVRKIRMNPCRTTHPEPGKILAPPPAASAKIRAILHEFADLPERAEQEHADLHGAREAVARLERENADLRRQIGTVDPAALVAARREVQRAQAQAREATDIARVALDDLDRLRERLVTLSERSREPEALAVLAVSAVPAPAPKTDRTRSRPVNGAVPRASPILRRGAGAFRMLLALAQCHPRPCSDAKIGMLAGLAWRHGTYQTYMSRMRKAGFVTGDSDARRITPAGLADLGSDWEPLPTGRALQDHWLGRLRGGKERILRVLVDSYPSGLEYGNLERVAGFARGSGTFGTYLGRMRKLDLIEREGRTFRASSLLFDA